MANANAPYFSVSSKDNAPIKSHNAKDKAIKAAGKDGYIYDRMLDIQMFVVKTDDGKLDTDFSPNSNFDFKKTLFNQSILSSHY